MFTIAGRMDIDRPTGMRVEILGVIPLFAIPTFPPIRISARFQGAQACMKKLMKSLILTDHKIIITIVSPI
jgi:hypothetical protein